MKVWNVESIPTLVGKNIIVTGGNSGLGFESVRIFAKKGAHVIMASRNLENARKAKEVIIEECGKCDIKILKLDLSSLSSIKSFTKRIKDSYEHIDILLNNAGVMSIPYEKTEDGFEKQFGVNHLGHFALTAQLFELLLKGNKPRIVNISSQAHRIGTMDFHNLMFEQGVYSEARAYGRSKLANLLFTYELHRRCKKEKLPIKILAAHPGSSRTNLMRYSKKRKIYKAFAWLVKLTSQDAFRGSLPGIRACLDLDVKSGEYYGPSGVMQLKGHPVVVYSSKKANNEADAKELWRRSEELTKIKFDIKKET